MTAKTGPKARADESPLPWRPRVSGAARFAKFCERFLVVPSGYGAGKPVRLRDWQRELVGSVMDADPKPLQAGWMLPRGQAKSTLCAGLALYELLEGPIGASIVVVAVDERQASIVYGIARRMVEMSPELESRVTVYKDRLTVPGRGAVFQVLPATPKALEGLNFSFCIVDEFGVVSKDTYEVVSLAQGKRPESLLLGIGTPPAEHENSPLVEMRDYKRKYPEDTSVVWREFSADAYQDHPVDCRHCLELANPALGDFLSEAAVRSLLPPRTRESTYRRARLCQLVTESTGSFLPHGLWDELGTDEDIPEGAEVVVSLDGSFNGDSTALLLARVSKQPHFEVLGLWNPAEHDDSYRVPISEVEETIRAAHKRYKVLEVVADPFRWSRSLQALESEGIVVAEFPWSPSRVGAATTDLYQSAINRQMTHNGDPRLAEHIANAIVVETDRGVRLDKARKNSTRQIDLAAAAVMAHSRATWRATRRKRSRKLRSFK